MFQSLTILYVGFTDTIVLESVDFVEKASGFLSLFFRMTTVTGTDAVVRTGT